MNMREKNSSQLEGGFCRFACAYHSVLAYETSKENALLTFFLDFPLDLSLGDFRGGEPS